MTGPTTAAELFALAEKELHELTLSLGTNVAGSAAQLTAAWPRFQAAGQRLRAVINGDQPGRPAPAPSCLPSRSNPFAITAATDDVPDPRLLRAADLLEAAADLLASRDRHDLSEQDRRTDAALVSGPLLTGAYQVAHATLRDPQQFETAASAVTTIRHWSITETSDSFWIGRVAGSFDDASTLPSAPAMSTALRSSLASSELDLTGLLIAAVYDWQHAALAAGRLAAPSSLDLRGTARAAGSLLALTLVLLRSYPDATETDRAILTVSVARIQQAGRSWNAAADWGGLTTATPADPLLVKRTSALDQAISLLGRTAGRWAPPNDVAQRAPADQAFLTARAALTAIQAIAEQHARVILRLAQHGVLYAPAARVTPTLDRVPERLAHRWVPVTAGEAAALTAAYQQLPDRTAAARLAYTALTSPARPITQPPERLPLTLSTTPFTAEDVREGRQPTPDPDPAPTLAGQRWHQTCQALDPRLVTDPHWPVLAGALDRVELAGVNVTVTLTEALGQGPLPEEHTARTLHYRLIQGYASAVTPHTVAPLPALPPGRSDEPSTAVGAPAVTTARPRR